MRALRCCFLGLVCLNLTSMVAADAKKEAPPWQRLLQGADASKAQQLEEQEAHGQRTDGRTGHLVEAVSVELVPGLRLAFPPGPGEGPGAVSCRDCGGTLARGPANIARNGPAYCLGRLAKHPDATLANRLKAHRLAAGLTLEALGERVGIAAQTVSDYERGRMAPQWRALVKLVGVLGVGLVDMG